MAMTISCRTRQIALTPQHVAQVHRALSDPDPDPALVYHTGEDYDALVRGLLDTRPGGADTWLSAYGSLIWKPEFDHVEVRRGVAQGSHRSFCFRIERFRGTKDQPGLMMSLDRAASATASSSGCLPTLSKGSWESWSGARSR
jgi:cation transport protein ChaC